MPSHAARTCSRSGSSWAAGGSCATRMRTCSGCLATRASALTAPPLLAKMSTGPASSAEISRCRSSACSSGVDSAAPSVRLLRLDEDDKLVIPKLTAEDVPAEARELKDELAGMLPSAPIASLLIELGQRTRFLYCFVHAAGCCRPAAGTRPRR